MLKVAQYLLLSRKTATQVFIGVDNIGAAEKKFKLHLNRNFKLLTAESYKFVFSNSQRFGNHSLTVLARKNNLDHSRLGLAISKKCAKRAVDRNRIKRLFRESFRLNQHTLPNVDIIAMCKPSILSLDNVEMRRQIETQWRFMRKKFSALPNE